MEQSSPGFEEVSIMKKIIGKAPHSFMFCDRCNPICLGTLILDHTRLEDKVFYKISLYAWARVLRCGSCGCRWAVCVECSLARSKFTEHRSAQKHHNSKHKNMPIDHNITDLHMHIDVGMHLLFLGVCCQDNSADVPGMDKKTRKVFFF